MKNYEELTRLFKEMWKVDVPETELATHDNAVIKGSYSLQERIARKYGWPKSAFKTD
jgi:hypothetical protein